MFMPWMHRLFDVSCDRVEDADGLYTCEVFALHVLLQVDRKAKLGEHPEARVMPLYGKQSKRSNLLLSCNARHRSAMHKPIISICKSKSITGTKIIMTCMWPLVGMPSMKRYMLAGRAHPQEPKGSHGSGW
jgi:hypothetical protein